MEHGKVRVCHISPVHDVVDNRVFLKQCCSLQAAGYEVFWVTPHSHDEVIQGVQIVRLKKRRSLFSRWLLAGWESIRAALKTKAQIYHFHDPEFIPFALLLRLLGHVVIYDIHEDYVSAVSQKSYIPSALRWLLSRVAGLLEKTAAKAFHQVIAERYYEERFPRAVKVLNYPRVDKASAGACRRSTTRLLYTGKVHVYRGALIHSRIPSLVDETTVTFLGRCSAELRDQMLAQSSAADKLEFTGIGEFVPFTEIVRQYQEKPWLAGLAIFPRNEHLERKELTKLFEYMQHGLPIIASNFPTWRKLVEGNGCGVCVDPDDEMAIKTAVEKLIHDEAFWQQCSRNGMAAAKEKYSWDSQREVLLNLYEQLSES